MYSIIKRVFDFILALVGIIATSPLWVFAIVGILVSDWGPIFYTAHRIGKGNKRFKMYKFRSMRVAKAANEASLRPDEDRIFPFGHFIRKTKIDELPQMINILNGTMSVIGPRPVAEDQFELFRYGKWNEAAKVPVGLSGPAALYDYIGSPGRRTEDAPLQRGLRQLPRQLRLTCVFAVSHLAQYLSPPLYRRRGRCCGHAVPHGARCVLRR